MKKEEMKKEKKKRHVFINILILLVILILFLIYYSKFIATSGIFTKEYRIANEKIPVNFSGVKIVHISDLLYGSTTSEKMINTLIKDVNKLKPDIIAFTGGLTKDGMKIKEKDIELLTASFSSMNALLGKYAIKGNDDYSNEHFESIMASSGFTLLNNSYELIYNEGLTPIFIGGLPSKLKDNTDILEMYKYYDDIKEDEHTAHYKIILIHEGDIASELLDADVEPDLILGGHSLNGSVILPYYGELFIPKGSKKYYSSYYKEGNTDIYISSGIGTLEYDYRFNNRPTFNFYRLKSI